MASCCGVFGCSNPDTARQGLVFNEVMTHPLTHPDEDKKTTGVWVEIFNDSARPKTLTGFGLSDERTAPFKWTFPKQTIGPGEWLVIRTLNFSLDASGQELFLTTPDGTLRDTIIVPSSPPNMSYGRTLGDAQEWAFLQRPTPAQKNTKTGWSPHPQPPIPESLHITEVMAENKQFLLDEDGDASDWFELHNPTDSPIDTTGLYVSDSLKDQYKWALPKQIIDPGSYTVFFASGKNRTGSQLHTNFKLKPEKDVLVLSRMDEHPIDIAPIPKLGKNLSLGRSSDNPSTWLVYTKATPGTKNQSQGRASDATSPPTKSSGVRINEAMAINTSFTRDEFRQYSDWIELYNPTDSAFPLNGYGLSDDADDPFRFTFPNLALAPHSYTVVWLSGRSCSPPKCTSIHAPFGLNPSGETLQLVAPNGTVVDRFNTGTLLSNISSGRSTDASRTRLYFTTPTPGAPNVDTAYYGYTPKPVIETQGGYFTKPVTVQVQSTGAENTTRYTLDGTVPTPKSPLVEGPISIAKNSVLKVRSFGPHRLPGRVATQTFLFDAPATVPTVALSTDPTYLFDTTKGLFEKGPNASSEFPYVGANFWKKTEIPAHLELIESTGLQGIDQDVGFRIFGAFSRGMAKKSFRIVARAEYGPDRIEYPLFPTKELPSVRSFVLRQSGQDAYKTRFRDVLMTQLVADSGVDYQGYRTVILYINGAYWGLYNIREKINEDFIADNHGIPTDDVNLLRANGAPDHGSNETYHRMVSTLRKQDMTQKEAWTWANQQMDIENFIDYQFFQIFFANNDNGNIRFWRESGTDGRWRWILYDTDWGFHDPTHKTLPFVANPEGTGASKAFSTSIWTALKQNSNFKSLFLKRAGHHLTHTLSPQRIERLIAHLEQTIGPEIKRDSDRWSRNPKDWNEEVANLKRFAKHRPKYLRKQIKKYFNVTEAELESFGFPPGTTASVNTQFSD